MTTCEHCGDLCMGMDPETGDETPCPACGRTPPHWEWQPSVPEDQEDIDLRQRLAQNADSGRKWTAMAMWSRLLDAWEEEGHDVDQRFDDLRVSIERDIDRPLSSITDRAEFVRVLSNMRQE